MLRLREMESRYNDGFSTLDRSFLDGLHFDLFGKEITNKGCGNCYRDAYIQIFTKLKRDKKMPKKSDFILKPGAVISFFGEPQGYTNANLTNEVAIRFIAMNAFNTKLFSELPPNWDALVAEYNKAKTPSTTDVASNNEDSGHDQLIAELKAKIETLEIEKVTAETEADNLRNELAGSNASLEKALIENEQLKIELASVKEKSSRGKKAKTPTDETPNTESTAQSLDLGE